ncbi:hypothetical protein F4703DRAFT_1796763 [Phycomyces blakesleeanus]
MPQWQQNYQEIFSNIWQRILKDKNEHEGIMKEFTGGKINWNIFDILAHLTLHFDFRGLALESIFNKLSKLICLVHLTIYQMSSIEHGQNIFMTNIESLHRNLSHMHYIKIDASLQSIPEEEMERTRNVKSANKIKIIHFIYDNIGLLWISYFAHKYLNLVSFNVTPLKILG